MRLCGHHASVVLVVRARVVMLLRWRLKLHGRGTALLPSDEVAWVLMLRWRWGWRKRSCIPDVRQRLLQRGVREGEVGATPDDGGELLAVLLPALLYVERGGDFGLRQRVNSHELGGLTHPIMRIRRIVCFIARVVCAHETMGRISLGPCTEVVTLQPPDSRHLGQ